jgi:hypothetical protein
MPNIKGSFQQVYIYRFTGFKADKFRLSQSGKNCPCKKKNPGGRIPNIFLLDGLQLPWVTTLLRFTMGRQLHF